jgi:GNAT superfamily N-acetyltransferase
MDYTFRQALQDELPVIWEILQHAIRRRREDGSEQWQDGYPNPQVVQSDIDKGIGYVLTHGDTVVAYSAVLLNDEPAYNDIQGQWLTSQEFIVVHRIAVSQHHLGKGLSKILLAFVEDFALQHDIHSVKVDTNFDNIPMMKVLDACGYTYCGEVLLRGGKRRAYEKVLP